MSLTLCISSTETHLSELSVLGSGSQMRSNLTNVGLSFAQCSVDGGLLLLLRCHDKWFTTKIYREKVHGQKVHDKRFMTKDS